jgi:hypothetical protein
MQIKDDSTKSSAPNSLPAVNPSNPLVGRLCDLIASIFNDGLEKKWYEFMPIGFMLTSTRYCPLPAGITKSGPQRHTKRRQLPGEVM